MKSKALMIKPKKAEKIRKYLVKEGLIRTDLKIKRENNYIYFPIKNGIQDLRNLNIIEYNFKENNKEQKLSKKVHFIPNNLKDKLPTSYDIIGSIILVKLKEEFLQFKEEIGKYLLKSNKNIKTVCLVKPIKNEFRTRELEIIAGEKTAITVHKEYGLKFEVDIEKTYFSPRLATERKRITDLIKAGEIVVDMFAGVAPFSIMIAKYANPKLVYAIDKNKYAIKYAQINIKKNNVLDKVEVINTDSKKIYDILNRKNVMADRVIMNLPFSAHLFFENALDIMRNQCIIHYYDILYEEKIDKRIKKLEKIALKKQISLTNFDIRKIKTYAPREFYIGIDIKAKKNADVA